MASIIKWLFGKKKNKALVSENKSQSSGDHSASFLPSNNAVSECRESAPTRLKPSLAEHPERFRKWRAAVEEFGHPDFPFLARDYSPNSRVACTGMVEWVAEAVLANDVSSIKCLLDELCGDSPSFLSRFLDSELECSLIGLSHDQYAYLKAAYLLQGALDSCFDEFFLINSGALMGAAILPWDFEFSAPDRCIRRANNFIKTMRKDAPAWEDVPFASVDRLRPMDRSTVAVLSPLLERISSLCVSARLPLLDAYILTKSSRGLRPLKESTFYETRRFGCRTEVTTPELLQSGFFQIENALDRPEPEKRFTKNELTSLLDREGISYRKSANKKALFEFAREECGTQLRVLAAAKEYVIPCDPLASLGDALLEYYQYQSYRLSVWAGGCVTDYYANSGRHREAT